VKKTNFNDPGTSTPGDDYALIVNDCEVL